MDKAIMDKCFVTVHLNLWVDRAIELPEQAPACMRQKDKVLDRNSELEIEWR